MMVMAMNAAARTLRWAARTVGGARLEGRRGLRWILSRVEESSLLQACLQTWRLR